MTALRPELPPLPERMQKLPLDHRGYPVPWFVAWTDDGKPLFQVMDSAKLVRAIKQRLCWVCGEPLGRYFAFVIGPMCAINRISGEPPSHRDCAVFSATACPFLTRPKMVRNEVAIDRAEEAFGETLRTPEGKMITAGMAIERNPGVALVWVTEAYRTMRAPRSDGKGDGILFRIGMPTEALWFAHGRPASLVEVQESIKSGLPVLEEAARLDGPDAEAQLRAAIASAALYLPQEESHGAG